MWCLLEVRILFFSFSFLYFVRSVRFFGYAYSQKHGKYGDGKHTTSNIRLFMQISCCSQSKWKKKKIPQIYGYDKTELRDRFFFSLWVFVCVSANVELWTIIDTEPLSVISNNNKKRHTIVHRLASKVFFFL